MFEWTMDQLNASVAEARGSAEHASRQLATIAELGWDTRAGRAFQGRVSGYRSVLARLITDLERAEGKLLVARREVEALEAQIQQQRQMW